MCYSRIEPTTGRQLRSKLASVEEGNGCDALDDTAAREIQVHVDLFEDTVFSATASSVGMNEKRVLPVIFRYTCTVRLCSVPGTSFGTVISTKSPQNRCGNVSEATDVRVI